MPQIDIPGPIIGILELIVNCQDQRVIGRRWNIGRATSNMPDFTILPHLTEGAIKESGAGEFSMQVDHSDVGGSFQLNVPLSGIGRGYAVLTVTKRNESIQGSLGLIRQDHEVEV